MGVCALSSFTPPYLPTSVLRLVPVTMQGSVALKFDRDGSNKPGPSAIRAPECVVTHVHSHTAPHSLQIDWPNQSTEEPSVWS
ncbi:hypothetical protein H0H93_004290 [Arthromyces matolae]|nr:hypothetical protein H0H93_004290 [Arthromyces matolae]